MGFHNIHKSQHDSIVIQYDSNKMDKKGEKVTPKNCYANPAKPDICMFLALGCYISINQNKFSQRVIQYSRERAKMDWPQTHTPKFY
jgi:hypothetical protein